LVALAVASIAGCGVRASLKQRLEGEWVGRAESAVERSRREWPRAVGANAPKYDQRSDESLDGIPDGALAQVDAVPPTTLEQFASVRVNLALMPRSKARLTLEGGEGGGSPLAATWKASAGEGGAAVLELTVDRSPDDALSTSERDGDGDDAKPVIAGAPGELRRFELRFLGDGERFTLMEEGADPRYGRLLFERAK
jgi:hypothetical protein